jgi:hypothetical protein
MSAALLNDPRFVSFVRERGMAGKEVTTEDFQSLVNEFQGNQAADTQRATEILSSISDPAPNAAAAESSFAPSSMDYNDLDALTGGSQRGPIMSTVEEVAAREQAQAAQQQAPAPEDPMQMFAQERIAPTIDTWRQKRSAINAREYKNTYAKKLDLDALDSLVARGITDLEGVGYWGPEQSAVYSNLREKEGAPAEEAFARTIQAKLNPAPSGQQEAVPVGNPKEALERVTKAQALMKEAPDDPRTKAIYEAELSNYERSSGVKAPTPVDELVGLKRNLDVIENAKRLNLPNIDVGGQSVSKGEYETAKTAISAQVNTLIASPNFQEALPVIDRYKFADSDEGKTAFEQAVLESGGFYKTPEGSIITPFKRYTSQDDEKKYNLLGDKGTKENPLPDKDDSPDILSTLARGERNMIESAINRGEDLSGSRFSPEVIEAVQKDMNESRVESALRSLYAGGSWMQAVGLDNPTIKKEDRSGTLGRTDNIEAAKFLDTLDPKLVTKVYEKANRFASSEFRNSDGTWSDKVDSPEKVLTRIRELANRR